MQFPINQQLQLGILTKRIADLEAQLQELPSLQRQLQELPNLQQQLQDLTVLYTEMRQLLLETNASLLEQRLRRRKRPDAAKHVPPCTPPPQ